MKNLNILLLDSVRRSIRVRNQSNLPSSEGKRVEIALCPPCFTSFVPNQTKINDFWRRNAIKNDFCMITLFMTESVYLKRLHPPSLGF